MRPSELVINELNAWQLAEGGESAQVVDVEVRDLHRQHAHQLTVVRNSTGPLPSIDSMKIHSAFAMPSPSWRSSEL